MAIQDVFDHKYQSSAPYPSNLSGFKTGTIMLAKHVLSGSDLGVNSRWTVEQIDKNGIVTFYPLSARALNSTRSRPLTGLIPYAANGLHTTKSYFEPSPIYAHAVI